MDIKTLRKTQEDPIIRDHELIRFAIREMVMLPTTELCSSTAKIGKHSMNEYIIGRLCKNLGLDTDDPGISTLGGLCREIADKKHGGTSDTLTMYLLSRIHFFFGIPRRDTK